MILRPEVLENPLVRLEPFEDRHKEPLRLARDADPDLWPTFYYTSLGGDHFDAGWEAIRAQQAAGTRIPFAVVRDGEVVGLSTLIGTTYYRPAARGGVANPATKRLLLDLTFAWGAQRVAFQVDAINLRSQAAMTRLGAVREGVMRNDKIAWTGRVRRSVIFSILAGEWTEIRTRLDERLAAFGQAGASALRMSVREKSSPT